MSIVENLLRVFLTGKAGSYTEIHRQLFYSTLPRYVKTIPKKEIIATTIWRLKKQGLVEKDRNKYFTTGKGKKYLEKIISRFSSTHPAHGGYNDNQIKKQLIILVFDIPEKQKGKRVWLRGELRLLDFEPLQKSVWIGKGPLPPKFIHKITSIGIFE